MSDRKKAEQELGKQIDQAETDRLREALCLPEGMDARVILTHDMIFSLMVNKDGHVQMDSALTRTEVIYILHTVLEEFITNEGAGPNG